MPATTPSAAMRASSSPASTRIGEPQARSARRDEFRAIAGVARRRRRHRLAQLDLEAVGNHAEAGQRLQRRGAAFGMQPSGRDHVAADAADGFFVLQGGGVAVLVFIDHQAHGIGADIDNGDGAARIAPCAGSELARSSLAADKV